MGILRLRNAAKLKRFLASAVLALGLFGISVAWAPSAESQIGYTTVSVASDLSVGTADFTLQGDDLFVGWGASDDFQLEYISASDAFRIQDDAGGTTLVLDLPAAASSVDVLKLTTTLGAADGSDAYTVLNIAATNADHTGSSNTVYGVGIDSITADAQADEYAIFVDTGWDWGAVYTDAGIWIDGNAASNAGISFDNGDPAGGTVEYEIYRSSGANEYFHELSANYSLIALGSGSTISHEVLEIQFTTGASNGSDTKQALNIDVENGNHTGASNVVYGVGIDAITADAEAVEYAIYADDGWEGVRLPSITQANLASLDNGSIVYCSDCNPDSTCTGSGSGAFAFRIGGSWACELN